MFITVLYFLPCLVSLLWLLSFIFKVKNKRQLLYTIILALYVFYCATYALYISPKTDYTTMVIMDAINIPVILTTLALLVLYLHFNYTRKINFNGTQTILLLPAIIIGTIVNLLYYIIRFDNAAILVELEDKGLPIPPEYTTEIYKIYNYFSEPFVNFCATVFVCVMLIQCIMIEHKGGYRFGDIMRFLLKGQPTTRARIIAILMIIEFALLSPLILIGRHYLFTHQLIGVSVSMLFAIIINFISHVEFYAPETGKITFYELSHINFGNIVKHVEEEMKIIEEEQNYDEQAEDTGDESSIMSRRKKEAIKKLHQLLDEEQIYLDEDLTSTAVAEKLDMSRSSFSSMITATYGISFRELLNRYRIEHAKRYMLENPSATQEAVAYESGFKNAQYLNRKFKEVVGDTPAMWIAKASLLSEK